MGNSTGGLIASYYLHEGRGSKFKGLILNAAHLSWNLDWFTENVLIRLARFVGGFWPEFVFQGGSIDQSQVGLGSFFLHKNYGGDWDFDLGYKLLHNPPKYAGWIKALSEAMEIMQTGEKKIKIPILSIRSNRSLVKANPTKDEVLGYDTVLDVEDIQKYADGLGPNVTHAVIANASHDVFLSPPDVRENAYLRMFEWLGGQNEQ